MFIHKIVSLLVLLLLLLLYLYILRNIFKIPNDKRTYSYESVYINSIFVMITILNSTSAISTKNRERKRERERASIFNRKCDIEEDVLKSLPQSSILAQVSLLLLLLYCCIHFH